MEDARLTLNVIARVAPSRKAQLHHPHSSDADQFPRCLVLRSSRWLFPLDPARLQILRGLSGRQRAPKRLVSNPIVDQHTAEVGVRAPKQTFKLTWTVLNPPQDPCARQCHPSLLALPKQRTHQSGTIQLVPQILARHLACPPTTLPPRCHLVVVVFDPQRQLRPATRHLLHSFLPTPTTIQLVPPSNTLNLLPTILTVSHNFLYLPSRILLALPLNQQVRVTTLGSLVRELAVLLRSSMVLSAKHRPHGTASTSRIP